jgi:hypothetical protein
VYQRLPGAALSGMRSLKTVVCALLLAVSLTGCELENTGIEERAGTAAPSATAAGCGRPGGQVAHWLPKFDSRYDAKGVKPVGQNPCPPFLDLASNVEQLIPEAKETEKAAAKELAGKVRGMAGRFIAAADTTRCFYEADRLAVAVYQHEEAGWSLGVVLVVRTGAGALADLASCYLVGDPFADGLREETRLLRPDGCLKVAQRERAGETYLVAWMGSSNWMCTALRRDLPSS